ncbi:MAG: hypothetical protein ACI9RO_002264 [Alteromonas macleodii]|jgi:hypothetical protein
MIYRRGPELSTKGHLGLLSVLLVSAAATHAQFVQYHLINDVWDAICAMSARSMPMSFNSWGDIAESSLNVLSCATLALR